MANYTRAQAEAAAAAGTLVAWSPGSVNYDTITEIFAGKQMTFIVVGWSSDFKIATRPEEDEGGVVNPGVTALATTFTSGSTTDAAAASLTKNLHDRLSSQESAGYTTNEAQLIARESATAALVQLIDNTKSSIVGDAEETETLATLRESYNSALNILSADDPDYNNIQKLSDKLKEVEASNESSVTALDQALLDLEALESLVDGRTVFDVYDFMMHGGGTHNHLVFSPNGQYLFASSDVGGPRFRSVSDVRWNYLPTNGDNASRQVAGAVITDDGIAFILVGNGDTFGQLLEVNVKNGKITELVANLHVRANDTSENDTGSRPRPVGYLLSYDKGNNLVRYGTESGLREYDVENNTDRQLALGGESIRAIAHYGHAVLDNPTYIDVGTRTKGVVRVSNLYTNAEATTALLLTATRCEDLSIVSEANGSFLAACHDQGVFYYDGTNEYDVTPSQNFGTGSNGEITRWSATAVIDTGLTKIAAIAMINPDSPTEWIYRCMDLEAVNPVWENATPSQATIEIGSGYATSGDPMLGSLNGTRPNSAGTFSMGFDPSDTSGNTLYSSGSLSLFRSNNFAGVANEIAFSTYNSGLSLVTVTDVFFDGTELLVSVADHNLVKIRGDQLLTGEPTKVPFNGLSGGSFVSSLGEGSDKVTVFMPIKDSDPYSAANDVVFHRGAGPVTEWSTTGFNEDLNGAGSLAAGEVPRAAGGMYFDNGDATYTIVVWADGVGFVKSTFTLSTGIWSDWTIQSSGPVADLTGGNHNQRRPGDHSANGSVLFAMQYKQPGIWRSTNKGDTWVNMFTQIDASDSARVGRIAYIESQDVLLVSNADSLWRVNAASSTSSATATQIAGINSGCQFDTDSQNQVYVHVRSTGRLLKFENIGIANSIDDGYELSNSLYRSRVPDLANGMYIFSANGIEYGATYYQGAGICLWTVPSVVSQVAQDGYTLVRNDTTIAKSGEKYHLFPQGASYSGPAVDNSGPITCRRLQVELASAESTPISLHVDSVENIDRIPVFLDGSSIRNPETGNITQLYIPPERKQIVLLPVNSVHGWVWDVSSVVDGEIPDINLSADITDLSQSPSQSVVLAEDGRFGSFLWRQADYSSEVAIDTLGMYYQARTGEDGSQGAYVRQFDGHALASWGGVGYDYLLVLLAANITSQLHPGIKLVLDNGTYTKDADSPYNVLSDVSLVGLGVDSTIIKLTSSTAQPVVQLGDNATLKAMTVDANSLNTTNAVTGTGLEDSGLEDVKVIGWKNGIEFFSGAGDQAKNIKLKKVKVTDPATGVPLVYPVRFNAPWGTPQVENIHLEDVVVEGVGGHYQAGVPTSGTADQISFQNCKTVRLKKVKSIDSGEINLNFSRGTHDVIGDDIVVAGADADGLNVGSGQLIIEVADVTGFQIGSVVTINGDITGNLEQIENNTIYIASASFSNADGHVEVGHSITGSLGGSSTVASWRASAYDVHLKNVRAYGNGRDEGGLGYDYAGVKFNLAMSTHIESSNLSETSDPAVQSFGIYAVNSLYSYKDIRAGGNLLGEKFETGRTSLLKAMDLQDASLKLPKGTNTTLDSNGEFAIARGRSWYRLASNSGTEDTLKDITGDISDGTVVVLSTSIAGEIINIESNSRLQVPDDYHMKSIYDRVLLIYNSAGAGHFAPLLNQRKGLRVNNYTNQTISNTTAVTDLISQVIDAYTLGEVQVSLRGAIINESGGNATVIFSITLGSTEVFSQSTGILPTGAQQRALNIDFNLYKTAIGSQKLNGQIVIGTNNYLGGLATDEINSNFLIREASSEDETTDLTLTVKAEISIADPDVKVEVDKFTVRTI